MIMSRKSQLDHGSFFSLSQTRPRATGDSHTSVRTVRAQYLFSWEDLGERRKVVIILFLCLFVAGVFKATQLFWQGYVGVGNAPMPVGL